LHMRHANLPVIALGCIAGLILPGQEAAPTAPSEKAPVIRTETRLVLVDAVVRDKKGNAVRDLGPKDFKVWEDGKEQSISAVTLENEASLKDGRRQYFILFFDNSTVSFADQMSARRAAGQFVERNAGPNKVMAVIEFGGAVRISQNFTTDVEKLKKAVSSSKFSSVGSMADAGGPSLTRAGNDFGSRTVLMALATVARNLGTVPGRKTLVLFSSGFPLTLGLTSEVTAAINACNRNNVAVYPVDARGLVAPQPGGMASSRPSGNPFMRLASFTSGFATSAASFASAPPFASGFQKPSGTPSAPPPSRAPGPISSPGTGGGTRPTPGSTGTMPPTRSTMPTMPGNNAGRGINPGMSMPRQPMPQPALRNPYNDQMNKIIPQIDSSVMGTQQVLHMLAEGTGGIVILNTNDLLAGLEKIANDQSEYYIVSYTPPESDEGSCHALKVKVNKGGANVRARSGYCNAKELDVLAGNSVEKTLEARVAGPAAGTPGASMQLPFFYTSPDTARVSVAMQIPYDSINFEKKKGKYQASVNVLGIAYRDGQVGARFSDILKLEFEGKKELEAVAHTQLHYETQFEIAPGQYAMKVAYDSGKDNFAKLESPLTIDSWDGKKLALSSMVLARAVQPVAQADSGYATELLEDRKPLIVDGMRITPSGTNRLKKDAANGAYMEIYEPLLAGDTQQLVIAMQLRILDGKTGEQKLDTGLQRVSENIREGNPMVPIGLRLPISDLAPGAYKVEVKAIDSAGGAISRRTDVIVE
jgi:VWFA-related protein